MHPAESPDSEKLSAPPSRIYANHGNPPLLALLEVGCKRVLDIGCGAGDNAALIKSKYPECSIVGITHTQAEADIAQRYMERCWVFDVEGEIPDGLARQSFDTLIFPHVLEHLKDPAGVLARFVGYLRKGGQVLIAVPNVLSWRTRFQFLMGRFHYESSGVLDDTHLRCFTFLTADKYLLSKCPGLQLKTKTAEGSVPLWWLRRYIFPRTLSECIDRWGCMIWLNLFGGQVLLSGIKK